MRTEQSAVDQALLAPIEVIVVQGTPLCNLNCQYCYLSEATRRSNRRIGLPQLSRYFSKILSSHYVTDGFVVSWHSGEPLVLGTEYYESAITEISRLAKQLQGPNFEILHDFQTNGTLIDEEWCSFFSKHRDKVTVGVSCDGPGDMHDVYRRDWRGAGSFDRTVKGMELLVSHSIPFSLIAVVSPQTLAYPDEFYNFFYSYRSHITEFRFNLLEEPSSSGEFCFERSSDQFYAFLKAILDKVESEDAQDDLLNIKNFSYFYQRLLAPPAERAKQTSEHMSRPFRAFNIEANGDVSTFYAGVALDETPDVYGDGNGLVIGNLNHQSLDELASSEKLARLMKDFERSHAACQDTCPYFALCPGGFNLTKFKRYGSFEVADTPECDVLVQTFSDALMDHMRENANA